MPPVVLRGRTTLPTPGGDRQREHRAEPPRAPELSRTVRQARDEAARYRHEREAQERRSLLRGLILLAVLVLLVSLLRAGDRAFPAGWLHRW